VKAQISVLVPLNTLSAFLIFCKFETKNCPEFCLDIIMTVSVLWINLVTVLFINLAVLLKRRFTRINTCLCELIQCAGEESFGLYRQISTVKHTLPLIEINNNSDGSISTTVHVRMCSGFICDAVDLPKSVCSVHTLVIVTFCFLIFIYDICCGVVEIVNVNKSRFVVLCS